MERIGGESFVTASQRARPGRILASLAALGGLILPADRNNEGDSLVIGDPIEDVCETVRDAQKGSEGELAFDQTDLSPFPDKMCDTFNNVFHTVTARYQSGEGISGMSEEKGYVRPDSHTFRYIDEESDFFVEVTVGVTDEGLADLNNPQDIVVLPRDQQLASIEEVRKLWHFSWDQEAEFMTFDVTLSGFTFSWNSDGMVSPFDVDTVRFLGDEARRLEVTVGVSN